MLSLVDLQITNKKIKNINIFPQNFRDPITPLMLREFPTKEWNPKLHLANKNIPLSCFHLLMPPRPL